jgi:hypothetical protein
MKTTSILVICVSILLSALALGCTNTQVPSEPAVNNTTTAEEKIVCNTPYIRFTDTCCLDQNNNSICDNDEPELQAAIAEKNRIAEDTVDYVNENFGFSATLKEINETNGVYKLALDADGQVTYVYVTTDGKLIFLTVMDTGKTVTGTRDDVAAKTLNFLSETFNTEITLDGIDSVSGVYKLHTDVNGEQADVYVTTDGKLIFISSEAVVEDNKQIQAEITKTNKPVVQLFVMSHCPYGLQMEKAIVPVAEILGNKIDFEVKFVYFAMHGQAEINEELRQYCIQKEFSGEYLDYLTCFISEGETYDCIGEVGIDVDELDDCISKTDQSFEVTEMYNDQDTWINGEFPRVNLNLADNEMYGVEGSPTLVVNHVIVNSERNQASLLSLICSAFISEPAECSSALTSATPSPGFY